MPPTLELVAPAASSSAGKYDAPPGSLFGGGVTTGSYSRNRPFAKIQTDPVLAPDHW